MLYESITVEIIKRSDLIIRNNPNLIGCIINDIVSNEKNSKQNAYCQVKRQKQKFANAYQKYFGEYYKLIIQELYIAAVVWEIVFSLAAYKTLAAEANAGSEIGMIREYMADYAVRTLPADEIVTITESDKSRIVLNWIISSRIIIEKLHGLFTTARMTIAFVDEIDDASMPLREVFPEGYRDGFPYFSKSFTRLCSVIETAVDLDLDLSKMELVSDRVGQAELY